MSKSTPHDDAFFIGWSSSIPRSLALFLFAISMMFLGLMAGLALSTRAGIDDPGPGGFIWGQPKGAITGKLEMYSYPVLRIPPGEDGTPAQALFFSGQGKRGIANQADKHNGQMVDAKGVYIKRGTITMMQLGNMVQASQEISDYTPAPPKPLGRWKIAGEICDGKCYAGAMRPGRGLAHKACANLCIIGGVPAVFVSASPVDGETFFLLANQDGQAVSKDTLKSLMALYIEAEGEVERVDDLLIFKMDTSTVKVLR
ncbi:MAG: hypothetical protein AAF228_04405 [Pseudomonadota bacterium]